MKSDTTSLNGIEYSRGIPGKYLFRVRETYVADPVAAMIRSRRVGAVKLDLVLRGLALLPEHAGKREPGVVLRHRGRLSYEVLHDLCRKPAHFSFQEGHDIDDDDPVVREKKRTWVGEQMQEFERRKMLRRDRDKRGRRPELTVLSDRGDGSPFDDPGADTRSGSGYVTLLGENISDPAFRTWSASDVVAYLCAMTADRFARHRHKRRTGRRIPHGMSTWFRQADWFNNQNPSFKRPDGHVAYAFSTTTIQRGLRNLRKQGLILASRETRNPETGQPFSSGARMIYQNRFPKNSRVAVANCT